MLAKNDKPAIGETVHDIEHGPMLWAMDFEGKPCFVKVEPIAHRIIPEGWSTLRWMVVRVSAKPQPPTKPSHDRCAFAELQALSLPVIMPVAHKLAPMRTGGKSRRVTSKMVETAHSLLPGYLLVGVTGRADRERVLVQMQTCRHVAGVLMGGGEAENQHPVLLSKIGFARFAQGLNMRAYDEGNDSVNGVKVLDLVEIMDGKFKTFTGIVEEFKSHNEAGEAVVSKAFVGVEMMGRRVRVELAIDSLRLHV